MFEEKNKNEFSLFFIGLSLKCVIFYLSIIIGDFYEL